MSDTDNLKKAQQAEHEASRYLAEHVMPRWFVIRPLSDFLSARSKTNHFGDDIAEAYRRKVSKK